MRRIFALTLSALTLLCALGGCESPAQKEPLTAQARTQLYKTAIENARDFETNDYMGIITSADDEQASLIFLLLGLSEEDMTSYALSVSPVNVRAYAIAAVLPAAGKDDDVLEALNDYVENQKESFRQYLEVEYENAVNTRLETLDDGTILMVMRGAGCRFRLHPRHHRTGTVTLHRQGAHGKRHARPRTGPCRLTLALTWPFFRAYPS